MKFLKLRLGLRKIKFKLMKPKTKPMVITLSVIFHSGRADRSPWQVLTSHMSLMPTMN
jgi:hypothetical protein